MDLGPVSDPSTPGGAAGPGPRSHCTEACLLVRLGFSQVERDRLAGTAALLEARQEVEQAIARRALADRLTAVTALAAGVAHELNNPLAYVSANVAFLAEKASRIVDLMAGAPRTPEDLDLAAQLAEALREARTGAERMRDIVRDLKTFAQLELEDQPRPVDLRRIVDSCLDVAWPEIRNRAQLVRDLAPVGPVLANEARLSQILLSLVVNAAQSIRGGHPKDHEVRVATRTLSDGRVMVEVCDTGVGIAPEHLPRIFDPFFTTKEPGTGTGLGLSICHAVVTSMGGEIEVESTLGKGSVFRVLLPSLATTGEQRARTSAPPASASSEGRRARILVVDDEPLVGTVLHRTLTEHDVVAVHTGQAAVERITSGERFDVVLADLLMPEMSGMELYRTLTSLHPGLARRFVFLTGGAFTPGAREFLEAEGVEWLEKPFDVAALRATVARHVAPVASA